MRATSKTREYAEQRAFDKDFELLYNADVLKSCAKCGEEFLLEDFGIVQRTGKRKAVCRFCSNQHKYSELLKYHKGHERYRNYEVRANEFKDN